MIRVVLAALVSVVLNGTALAAVLAGYWYAGWGVRTHNIPGGGTAAEHLTLPALVLFEILFYGLLLAFVGSVIGTTILAARLLKSDRAAAVVFALFVIGLLGYPLLAVSSALSACALGEGFPLGAECD